MNIGIITFHRADNYGAALQTYALKTYLQSIGHTAVVVDYRSKAIEKGYKLFDWRMVIAKNPKKLIQRNRHYFSTLCARKTRAKLFSEFRNRHFDMLDYKEIESLNLFVIGSDQVWNPFITGGYDTPYFAKFQCKDSQRVISYAASAGWAEKQLDGARITEVLASLDAVSVRENSLQNILQPLTSKNIDVVVDPTLLLNSEEWAKIARKPKSVPQKYLLLYQMFVSEKTLKLANQVAADLGVEVVEIDGYIRDKDSANYRSSCSVEEFLWYFQNANYVVTSSFHGTVFSILNNKNFSVVEVDSQPNNRVRSLLGALNLSSNIINDNIEESNQKVTLSNINYQEVSSRLCAMLSSSKEFIAKI